MGLLMAPAETTAVQQEKPLFVQGDDAIYRFRLESVPASVHLVARWTRSDFSAEVACGGSILGILEDSRTVIVLDTAAPAAAAVPGPRLRGVKREPVMLAVGDDTVVVMDTILQRPRDCCFEALRRLPGRRDGWRADPLPDPPVPVQDDLDDDDDDDELEDELEDYVTAYFVMGTRLWISVLDKGTFSLDLSSSSAAAAAWRVEGSWELPDLIHYAAFVPELGCAVGLQPSYGSGHDHKVCAVDVVQAQKEHRAPVVRHVWKFPSEQVDGVPNGEMMDLVYLGNGTFCMARCVILNVFRDRGTSFTLLDLDFKSLPGAAEMGWPQLTKRGEPHVHAWSPSRLGVCSLL